jgi:hypothetical protein
MLFSVADGFDDSALHFFEEHLLPLLRIRTDRRAGRILGTGDKALFSAHLAINNVDYVYSKGKSSQTGSIDELVHKTFVEMIPGDLSRQDLTWYRNTTNRSGRGHEKLQSLSHPPGSNLMWAIAHENP